MYNLDLKEKRKRRIECGHERGTLRRSGRGRKDREQYLIKVYSTYVWKYLRKLCTISIH
jgi:hypothetical protein